MANKYKQDKKKTDEDEKLQNFLYIHESIAWPHRTSKPFFEILDINRHLANIRERSCFRWLMVRASLFRSLRLYDECLNNLQLALDYGAPLSFVSSRKDDCLRDMERYARLQTTNFFRLSYPANARIPALAGCLELHHNIEFGRHIVTNRDLKAGDIVGISESFFKVFHHDALYYRCSYCFKENYLNLISCPTCKLAMYCSEQCRLTAKTEYHQIDCTAYAPRILNHSIQTNFYDFMPLKMLLHAVHICGGVERMRTFLGSSEAQNIVTVFDFDLSDSTGLKFEKNLLLATLSLKNDANIDTENQFHDIHGVIADHPKLRKMWNEENGRFLDELLVKLIKISSLKTLHTYWTSENFSLRMETKMTASKLDGNEVYVNPIGLGVDPFSALMNGSCCPNIRIINVDNKNIWVVACPIEAGEQLFRTYGQDFITGPSARERRQSLFRDFGFYCNCQACVTDFPSIQQLSEVDDQFVYDDDDLLDNETAENIFRRNCNYINRHYRTNFPSKELCYAMSLNVYKLRALAKPANFYP